MSDFQPGNEEVKEVPVELVTEPLETAKPVERPKYKTFFHPWSGLSILAVDWIAFGMDVPTAFLLTPVVSIIAYFVTYYAVYKIQTEQSLNTPTVARRKAMLGAIAAAVPFPITGTIVGVGILMLSGLPTSVTNAAIQVGKMAQKK